jgi:hypothetical protein
MNLLIIGAGQAGLLAARRLANYMPIVYEQQSSLPNNHSALLRFRSDIVSEATGIPFKKVNVYKGVLCEDGTTITNTPTIRDINAYSLKSTGICIERSIINTRVAERYIAQQNFIEILGLQASIVYDNNSQDLLTSRLENPAKKDCPIISTIPMPKLMELLKYPFKIDFNVRPIWTINCELHNADIYQTLYVPYEKHQPYRVSVTGNKLTLECAHDPSQWSFVTYISRYLQLLFPPGGVKLLNIKCRKQDYGKIVPIEEYERQKFILWASDNYNIYSLGRYATWRQILLDDVVKDISVIQKFIDQRNNYNRTLSSVKGERPREPISSEEGA